MKIRLGPVPAACKNISIFPRARCSFAVAVSCGSGQGAPKMFLAFPRLNMVTAVSLSCMLSDSAWRSPLPGLEGTPVTEDA
ncbi:MAG: hypothetical protein ACD_55C00145G0001 [uncultured bacterium]|nr:MAG: hypothetical protein ACD_55C00145G0001 [uncultured bacterium]